MTSVVNTSTNTSKQCDLRIKTLALTLGTLALANGVTSVVEHYRLALEKGNQIKIVEHSHFSLFHFFRKNILELIDK